MCLGKGLHLRRFGAPVSYPRPIPFCSFPQKSSSKAAPSARFSNSILILPGLGMGHWLCGTPGGKSLSNYGYRLPATKRRLSNQAPGRTVRVSKHFGEGELQRALTAKWEEQNFSTSGPLTFGPGPSLPRGTGLCTAGCLSGSLTTY